MDERMIAELLTSPDAVREFSSTGLGDEDRTLTQLVTVASLTNLDVFTDRGMPLSTDYEDVERGSPLEVRLQNLTHGIIIGAKNAISTIRQQEGAA